MLKEEFCLIEITDEDMEITGKWLARVKVVETEEEDEDGEIYVNRELVFELLHKFTDDLELYFEIAKLPVVNFGDGRFVNGRTGKA